MSFKGEKQNIGRLLRAALPVAIFLLMIVPASLRAQQSDEFDQYKVRLEAYMFYSNPTGNFQASSDQYPVDLQKNLGFSSYATFSGKVDWKFTHKNHFYLWISPFYTSTTHTISNSFTFQGQPFDVGLVRQELAAFISGSSWLSVRHYSHGSADTSVSGCKWTCSTPMRRSARRELLTAWWLHRLPAVRC